MDIIFLDFSILYQIFSSPQVKQSVIISSKYGMYELPRELPKDLGSNLFPMKTSVSLIYFVRDCR